MKVTHLKLEVEEQVVEKKEPKGVKKRWLKHKLLLKKWKNI
jgi:hypothetical protein